VEAPTLVEFVEMLNATKYSPGVIDILSGTDTGRIAGDCNCVLPALFDA
jgi:hypothetical protein